MTNKLTLHRRGNRDVAAQAPLLDAHLTGRRLPDVPRAVAWSPHGGVRFAVRVVIALPRSITELQGTALTQHSICFSLFFWCATNRLCIVAVSYQVGVFALILARSGFRKIEQGFGVLLVAGESLPGAVHAGERVFERFASPAHARRDLFAERHKIPARDHAAALVGKLFIWSSIYLAILHHTKYQYNHRQSKIYNQQAALNI